MLLYVVLGPLCLHVILSIVVHSNLWICLGYHFPKG